MHIKEIQLTNFRNYQQLSARFDPGVNLFYGQNAQGKTNLLESIYLTSMGKSFRTAKDRDMIRFGADFFRIKVTAVREDSEEITVELAVNGQGKKGIKINGIKAKKLSQLFENIYMVIFSPEDLKIVKDEPEKRRKFIDRELCQIKPSYYSSLSQYKKALMQRNTYLKEPKIDETILDIWDLKLAQYGSRIIKDRAAFVKKLDKISSQIHSSITGSREHLRVFYEPSVWQGEGGRSGEPCRIEDSLSRQAHGENSPCFPNQSDLIPEMPDITSIQEAFYGELKKNRKKDQKIRTTSKGPHKDDICLQIGDMDIRSFGSQGQQRTAALSLKLSEIRLIKNETGENPILLLDDVLSELDSQRQQYLISSLEDTQIFITATELSEKVEQGLEQIRHFHISGGSIVPGESSRL